MNVSDRLLDLTAIRQLLLLRLISGENIRINKEYDAIAADLEKQLRGPELTTYKGKRLNQAIEELKARVIIPEPAIGELAATEADYTVQSMAQVGIDAVLPPEAVIDRVARTSLIQGATMQQWWGKLNETTQFDVERTIKNGVLLGQTNREIATALVGKGTDKGSEAISKARRDAVAITRTAVQTLSNEARLATYAQNADIIKAIQWVSTLDGRTSDICIARSGKTWSFPDFEPQGHNIPWGGGPPAHWACRSTTIPITKTFAEIDGEGKADPATPVSTRASMNGQVAADLSFDQFLRSKPPEFADEMLGKGRAQLWRDGKITLSQLLSAQGTPLTLAQLKARYGNVTKVKADDTPEPKPIPARAVNAPAFNPEVNADTIKVISRKEAQKALTEQFAAGALAPEYAIESRLIYRGLKPADIGRSSLNTNFSDEAVSMIAAIKPELDDLSARFNVPPLRGFKTSTAAIGSMGDGIMTLHPEYFTSYAANVGAKAGASKIAQLEATNLAMRETLGGYSKRLTEINDELKTVARNSEVYDQLWVEKADVIKSYNKLAADINKNVKILQLNKRNDIPASTWKPGDDLDKRPHGAEHYMTNGVDRARAVLYHEFAHHIHQTYAKTAPAMQSPPPLETELRQLFREFRRSKSRVDAQPTKYGLTNEKEWFAESFALYMMDRRDLVDPEMQALIERMLNEQANR